MKSIFTTILMAIVGLAQAQSFQGTLRPGSQANSAICAIRSSANFSGNPTNIQFSLAVPISVGVRPTLVMLNNFYSANFASSGVSIIQTASTATDYIYLINFSSSLFVSKTYTANTLDNVCEISFQGNPTTTNNLRLVQLPDGLATTGTGGENGQYNFYIEFQGVDRTNTTQMFFSANGGTVVNNANGYTAFSSVTLGSSIALPVNFTSFTASKTASNALLQWSVATLQDVAYFTVQTIHGNTVTNIANVPVGTTTSYQFNDGAFNLRLGKQVVYRILAMQKDGSPVFSSNAILSKQFATNIQLLNNQFASNAMLALELLENSKISIVVYSTDGRMVHQLQTTGIVGYQQISVQKRLPAGSYKIQVQVGQTGYTFNAIQP